MKLNKTLLVAGLMAGSLFAGNLALPAQDSTNAPQPTVQRGRFNLELISKQLDLTDDQKPKVKVVVDELQQKTRELRQDPSLSQEDRRAKNKELREAANAKLKDILTADQYAKWLKFAPAGRRPAGSPTPPAAPPQN